MIMSSNMNKMHESAAHFSTASGDLAKREASGEKQRRQSEKRNTLRSSTNNAFDNIPPHQRPLKKGTNQNMTKPPLLPSAKMMDHRRDPAKGLNKDPETVARLRSAKMRQKMEELGADYSSQMTAILSGIGGGRNGKIGSATRKS